MSFFFSHTGLTPPPPPVSQLSHTCAGSDPAFTGPGANVELRLPCAIIKFLKNLKSYARAPGIRPLHPSPHPTPKSGPAPAAAPPFE